MRLEKMFERKQRKHGPKLLQNAIAEGGEGATSQSAWSLAGAVLAPVVLLVPVLLILAGVAVIILKFPSIIVMLIGAVLCFIGYIALPKRPAVPADTYSRRELVAFFALLDQISAELGATPPKHVRFCEGFESSMQQVGGNRLAGGFWLISIGFPLWCAASDDEKRAILVRNLASTVSEDPMCKRLFWAAENILLRLYLLIVSNAKSSEFGEKYFLGSTSVFDEIHRKRGRW